MKREYWEQLPHCPFAATASEDTWHVQYLTSHPNPLILTLTLILRDVLPSAIEPECWLTRYQPHSRFVDVVVFCCDVLLWCLVSCYIYWWSGMCDWFECDCVRWVLNVLVFLCCEFLKTEKVLKMFSSEYQSFVRTEIVRWLHLAENYRLRTTRIYIAVIYTWLPVILLGYIKKDDLIFSCCHHYTESSKNSPD